MKGRTFSPNPSQASKKPPPVEKRRVLIRSMPTIWLRLIFTSVASLLTGVHNVLLQTYGHCPLGEPLDVLKSGLKPVVQNLWSVYFKSFDSDLNSIILYPSQWKSSWTFFSCKIRDLQTASVTSSEILFLSYFFTDLQLHSDLVQ